MTSDDGSFLNEKILRQKKNFFTTKKKEQETYQ